MARSGPLGSGSRLPLLILLVASLLVACGSETTLPTPTQQPPGDPPAGISTVSLTGSIVVPLDPNGGDQYRLYLIGPENSEPQKLTPEDTEIVGGETAPDWSSDGQRVVFVGYVGDGVNLFTIKADGSDLSNLTNIAGHVTQPRWSPDGNQIVYINSDDGSTNIHVMNADGSDQRQLTSEREDTHSPIWSPDGSQLAFLRTVFVDSESGPDPTEEQGQGESMGLTAAEGEFETTVFVMRSDGTDRRALTTVQFAEGLQWSPDGRQLAFTSYSSFRENQHAQVINLDGSDQRTLDNGTVSSSLPRWSPDGLKMSAVITDPGGSEAAVVVMNADGADVRRVTQMAGWHAWSPDGTQIIVLQSRLAVSGDLTGRSNLYLISADSSNQRLLLEDAAIGGDPAWRPMSQP